MMAGDRRSRWGSHIIVLATGMVVGLFVWKSYFIHVPHLYPVEFKQGRWLVASDDGPQGYFRTELYISEIIEQAWLTVAATDSYILYINGKAVDSKGYASLKVSGIYDISHYLHRGKNVLGVVARRLSYPGPAMAALEGAYRDQVGHEHSFGTNASWKFSPVEQRQGSGEILWYSEAFDAAVWTAAWSTRRPEPSEIYPLNVHPLVFSMPAQGKWIKHSNAPWGPVTFLYKLRLPTRPEDAWIRIAAEIPSALAVNGVTIQGRSSTDLPGMGVDGASIWKSDERISTDLYNITAFLHAGVNQIAISSGGFSFLPGLLIDGFAIQQGKLLTFGSDSSWVIADAQNGVNGHPPRLFKTVTLADNELFPIKQVMAAIPPSGFVLGRLARTMFVLLIAMGLTYLLWWLNSRLLSSLHASAWQESARLDALTHLPVLLILSILLWLTFDVRFDPAFPFQKYTVWASLGFLLICKGVLIFEALLWKGYTYHIASAPPLKKHRPYGFIYFVSLFFLMCCGAFLRLQNLGVQSLYHDEIHMVSYVQGIFQKGFPYKMIGPIERPLATYELLPYPIALSTKLLGFSDFALRLPAALFGIMTIWLIYIVGKHIFERRVGLLAAALFAFCPQALIWAKYLWHPQQTQFFALLTSYLFLRAIRPEPLNPKFLYLATASLILTYLSWEGAGFLLPALGLGLIALKGRNTHWVRDKHVWIAVACVCLAIAIQLVRRLLLQVPYLVVGKSLSDVSLPTLYFLNAMYDPTYYIHNFLWLENNAILTILSLYGLAFLFRSGTFRFYSVILLSIIFMMTNMISNSSIRYVYYLQPFLILLASYSAISILQYFYVFSYHLRSIIVRPVIGTTVPIFLLFVILTASIFMKLHRLNDFYFSSGFDVRENIYYIDYRGSSEFIKSHYNNGDVVVSIVPQSINYYAMPVHQYFSEYYTIRQVLYDPTGSSNRYLERTIGVPVLRGFEEFLDIINSYKRVWIVCVPYRIYKKIVGPEIRSYVSKNGEMVYESYNAKIYLLQK